MKEGRNLEESYTWSNMPPGIPIKDIKLLTRWKGGYEDWIFAIFKTRDGSSIFSMENLNEMTRFSEILTSHEYWPMLCVREPKEKVMDGYGCGESSYRNLTGPSK